MIFKFNLRYRVALTFLIAGLLVSTSMGGILYWLAINMEEDLIEETLSTELDDYIKRYTTDASTPAPSGVHIQVYVITKDTPKQNLPSQLQHLPLGLNHILIGDVGYYIASRVNNNVRFLVLYADKQIKLRKSQYLGFFALGITLMTVFSGILGRWLAGRVIAPVTELAQLVSKMGPDFKPLSLSASSDKYPYNEIEDLTCTINGYHQRLVAFNERERAFTSDVSHELRTPIAVIQGASEMMLAQTDLTDNNRRRLDRIVRAASQITRLTSALLALAREESDNDNQHQYPVEQVLIQVIDEHKYLLAHKPVEVKLNADGDLSTLADPTLLYVVLANIVRNAFSYTHQGTVHICQQGDSVIIKDTGAGMKKDQLLRMFDRHYSGNRDNGGYGIGLSLVWRICQRYGWEISVHSHEGCGTSVELLLGYI